MNTLKMSDTPETDFHCWTDSSGEELIAVCKAEFCRKLERERDEAMELLASEKITRNHIIKRSVEVERERDEAREKIERQADIGCAFQKTNPAMCGRYKQERDEAREGWREARKYLKWVHDVAESQKKWTIRTLCKEGLIKTEKQNERTN